LYYAAYYLITLSPVFVVQHSYCKLFNDELNIINYNKELIVISYCYILYLHSYDFV